MAIVFPEGTQNYPGKIVKATVHRTKALFSSSDSDYFWGGEDSTDGGLAVTCHSTSNLFIVNAMLMFGAVNNNGGLKLLVDGGHSNNSQYYWGISTDSAYDGGSSSYTGASNTSDDSWGNNESYCIQPTGMVYMSHPDCTFPGTTFYLGWHHTISAGSGEVNFNRQGSNNGGRGTSFMIVYEVEP